jgi:hypothetical protein
MQESCFISVACQVLDNSFDKTAQGEAIPNLPFALTRSGSMGVPPPYPSPKPFSIAAGTI